MAWVNGGGIIRHKILLDYAGWAAKNSIAIQYFESTDIPLGRLLRIVKEKEIKFRVGDILHIRSGYRAAYKGLSANEQVAIPQRRSADFLGVESCKETLQWIWEIGLQPWQVIWWLSRGLHLMVYTPRWMVCFTSVPLKVSSHGCTVGLVTSIQFSHAL